MANDSQHTVCSFPGTTPIPKLLDLGRAPHVLYVVNYIYLGRAPYVLYVVNYIDLGRAPYVLYVVNYIDLGRAPYDLYVVNYIDLGRAPYVLYVVNYIDLGRAPYVLYVVNYIDSVSRVPFTRYHYRLDWEIWIRTTACQSYIRNPNGAPSGFEMCVCTFIRSQHFRRRGSQQPTHVSNLASRSLNHLVFRVASVSLI